MSTPTFLIYDIETSGLDPCFGQVFQFAAIRTTLDLEEIERYEYRIKINPDTIPHPQAMLTTGLSMEDVQQGESEYDVISRIHALMNTPNTCSMGYNTLGFDDEFLRFSFFRNGLTPYTHQYANGCSRADIFPITLLYSRFKRDVLSWPERDDRPSLKLEDINAMNSLAKGSAHDAMVDVEATLALAKRLYAEKATWDYAMGYFNKGTDAKRLNTLPALHEHKQHAYRYGLLLSPSFGYQQNYLAPVLYLGQHMHYKNQSLWLRLDKEPFTESLFEGVIDFSFVVRKKMAEPPLLLPPDDRYLAHLTSTAQEQTQANLEWLNTHIDCLNEARTATAQESYPDIPHCDAQASLYQAGFPTPEDNRMNQRFKEANCDGKVALLDEISNPLYYTLFVRVLGRLGLNLGEHQAVFDEYLSSVWSDSDSPVLDYKGKPRFNVKQCLQAIVELNPDQQSLLADINSYISEHTKHF